MSRLNGKVAVITGSGSGLGAEAAKLFAREGCSVVVNDVDVTAGERVVAEITGSGGKAVFIPADVRSTAQVEALYAGARKAFGKVNVLYNNAGVSPGDDDGVVNTTDETWDLVLEINVKGVARCCRAGIPLLREAGGGSIINVASFVATLGAATPQIAYTASKGAVLSMTREIAIIHARGADPGQRALTRPGADRPAGEVSLHRREAAATAGAHSDGPLRRAARDRPGGAVPCLRRIVVHHRRRLPGGWRDHGGVCDAGGGCEVGREGRERGKGKGKGEREGGPGNANWAYVVRLLVAFSPSHLPFPRTLFLLPFPLSPFPFPSSPFPLSPHGQRSATRHSSA